MASETEGSETTAASQGTDSATASEASPADCLDGPIRHVLVATDFSPAAERALAWGAQVARLHGARLTLVHALAPPVPVAEFSVPLPLEAQEEMQAAAQEELDRGLARVTGGASGPLDARTVLREGPAHEVVRAVAEELPADLVVTGTQGRTGLAHLLLGSNAERIVQTLGCPVLSVHPEDPFPEGPPRTILVPTDFSRDAAQAVAAADRLLACVDEGARILLLHVYDAQAQYRIYGAVSAYLKFSERVAEAVGERLDRTARELGRGGLRVETLAREGVPSQAIVQVAEEEGADLIAMGTHGHSGLVHLLLGSTAQRVVQLARCPVLTVRRGDGEP